MAAPEFNRVDLFIQNSLPKAPSHFDDVEKGMWALVEFAKNPPQPKRARPSGWQKISGSKSSSDILLPIEIDRIKNYAGGFTNTELQLPEAINFCLQTFKSTTPLSIDRPLPNSYAAPVSLANYIPDNGSNTEGDGCENTYKLEFARIASTILTKQEYKVLSLTQQGLNTVEIGKIIGCVRQYVPQIEKTAKRKLYDSPEFKKFMGR